MIEKGQRIPNSLLSHKFFWGTPIFLNHLSQSLLLIETSFIIPKQLINPVIFFEEIVVMNSLLVALNLILNSIIVILNHLL